MAIAAWDGGQPKLQVGGTNIPRILHGNLEANSQSFKAGHLVFIHTDGLVTYYTDADVPIAGIALADATTVSSGKIEIPILAVEVGSELVMQVATSADVVETCNTTCVVGVAYDTNASVAVPSYVDSSDTTNPCLVFLGPAYDATGAADNWGRFQVMAAEVAVAAP